MELNFVIVKMPGYKSEQKEVKSFLKTASVGPLKYSDLNLVQPDIERPEMETNANNILYKTK